MKKLFFLITLAVFAFSSASAQNEASTSTAADNPNAPVITFDKSVHDYGTLEYGAEGTCYFSFTNTGKEPLIVQQPRSK